MDLALALRSAEESVPLALQVLEQTVQAVDGQETISIAQRHFVCRSLLRAGQILDSAAMLAKRHRFQDTWILGRALAEFSINTCYLQTASPEEFSRWSNYDLWTDERLISNLSVEIPVLEESLNPRELAEQRRVRKHLEETGLYDSALRGTWSKLHLHERAKAADVVLGLTPNPLTLLYRLAVKIGDAFVHSSPKAIGTQGLPVSFSREPTAADVQATTQALSLAATSVIASVTFTRKRFGMSAHMLDEKIGDLLKKAYTGSYVPSK